MNINLLTRILVALLFIGQITILFPSCSQIKPKQNNDCETIKHLIKTHKTELNKKGKAPQGYGTFEETKNSIKLIKYKSEGRELKALLDTTNIERGVKKKAVVYMHGGFSLGYGDVNDCKKFTDKGYIVLAPSYRGENGNPGNYELLFGEITDAKNAIKWLAKQDFVHEDSIYTFGHSIGGSVSFSLTLHDDVSIALGGSCAGFYHSGTFESWSKDDEDSVPFDVKNQVESNLRLPTYSLECMERRHFMYVGTDDGFKPIKEFVEKELYPRKKILLEIEEVEGNHFSSLDNAIEAFIKQIEK